MKTDWILTFIICLTISLSIFGMRWLVQMREDNYCRTTPMDRIDRERCNLNK